MEIQINEKSIALKKSMRSLILFESITDRAFGISNISDMVTYFYCCILASEKDIELSWDDFLDWLDDNNNAMNEFKDWLAEQTDNDSKLAKKKRSKVTKEKP